MINETLQWISISVILVFVVGLTRQLGQLLTSSRADKAATQGPDLGRRLPRGVMTEAELKELRALMSERDSDWAAVLAVDERCMGCNEVIGRLETEGVPRGAPVVAISRQAGPEFAERLSATFDLVAVGAERLRAADLQLTPFVLLLDSDLVVAHKSAATSVAGALAEWRGEDYLRISGPAVPDTRVVEVSA